MMALTAFVGPDREGLERAVASARGIAGRTLAIEADVRDEARMAEAVEHVVRARGPHLRGASSRREQAGVTGPAATPIDALSLADWDRVIATDLTGLFLCLKAELPAIVASGGGAILNLSSASGIVGLAGLSAYTAAKHGIVGLTRSAALEYAEKGVRVNCIGPGYVPTPRMLQTPDDLLNEIASSHPMGRLATLEEVAELAAFLLSDKASFCTGGFYPVDGGYTAQ